MAQYSKNDVLELARMALVDCEMFPILDLRSAVEIIRLARAKGG